MADESSKIISWSDALYENNGINKKSFDEHPWSKSVVPILTTDISKRTFLSSCCFITYREYYFLLTAEHCLNGSATQYVNLFSGPNIDLNQFEWLVTDRDDLDIAFVHLPHPEDYNLEVSNFIDLEYQPQKNDKTRANNYYLALGYPNKPNKLFIQKKRGINRFSTFIHNSNHDAEHALESHNPNKLLFNKGIHIACDFTLKNQFYTSEGSTIPRMFMPEGMSGGALIYLNDINDCANGEAPKFSLAGIIIELKQSVQIDDERKDFLITTSAGAITQVMDEYIDSRYKSKRY